MEQSGRTAVVADDTALFRRGVASVLETCGVEVVAETHSGRAAVRLAGSEKADLVVVGTTTDLGPAEVTRKVRRLRPPPAVVGLIGRGDDAARLIVLGVEALLLRTARTGDLADAVLRVYRGETVVAPALLPALVGEVGPLADGDPHGTPDSAGVILTSREREVLAFLAEGLANREIAAEMYVTLATVKTHVAHIYSKLDARNRNEALGRAVLLGILG